MRSVELLAFGIEGTLGHRLTEWAHDHGVWYRPVQHLAALHNLLRKGSLGLLLLRVGRDLLGEMELLHDAAQTYSEVMTIVLGDVDHPLLEGLAYDLGASAVLFPPRGSDELFEMLARWA
jgi:hypothetical protein